MNKDFKLGLNISHLLLNIENAFVDRKLDNDAFQIVIILENFLNLKVFTKNDAHVNVKDFFKPQERRFVPHLLVIKDYF